MPTRNGILKQAAGGKSHVVVNSYHHQEVIYRDGGPLELAAKSWDGVTEATEFKNGRGLLLQFHPEITLSENSVEPKDFARALVAQVLQIQKSQGGLRCRRTHLN